MISSPDQMVLLEPPTTWSPPTGPLPRLDGRVVALDLETRDDAIPQDRGAGWVYGAGWVCGVAAAWAQDGERRSIYVPIRHPDTECRPQEEVLAWVEDILLHCPVIFHHSDYDLGWLVGVHGCSWPERMHDTYIQAVVLSENHLSYDLDSCCERAGVQGKDRAGLRNAAAAWGYPTADLAMQNLWRLPARHVGPYAEQDARATLELHRVQWPQVVADRTENAYRTEIALVPVLHRMRMRGIRVSTDGAEQAQAHVRGQRDDALTELSRMVGRRVTIEELRSPDAIAPVLEAIGLVPPRTPKTRKPSVTKGWLASQRHPGAALIRRARQTSDLADKFIGTYILGSEHRGRIHAEIHQLRDSDGGTRTHRLSYSSPPLQQMSGRDEEFSPQIRGAFMPEDGEWWCAADFSNQEPRLAAHFAIACRVAGSRELAQRYADNPHLDSHQLLADMLGWPRKRTKDTYQALSYGAGVAKVALMLGLSQEQATEVVAEFHRKVPWIKGISDLCESMAQERGWIRMIDGARGHFDLWEPRRWSREDDAAPLPLDEAHAAWPDERLVRAHTRKAFNKVVQGSAARQAKRAMVLADQAGLPLMLQMHDELDVSAGSERTGQVLEKCMLEAVKTEIPMRVDVEFGRDWGHAKHTWEERDA